MNTPFDPHAHAQALEQAWRGAPRVSAADLPIADEAQAYAVQDALATRLGRVAGWKVGASNNSAEPNAAPLPATVVRPAGTTLGLPARSMRLIELEVAVRLRQSVSSPGQRKAKRGAAVAPLPATLDADGQSRYLALKAWRADKSGNLQFRLTARNFNPAAAMAGKICVVEVEQIVEIGDMDPDQIHLPGVYVHRLVLNAHPEKRIEKRTITETSGV
jgi:hypothetical protein